MIIELDDKIFLNKVKENALIYYDAKKKNFCFKTIEEINSELIQSVKNLNKKVETLECFNKKLIKEDILTKIDKLENDISKEHLINNVALFLFFIDLQINNLNEDVNLESLIDWCKSPTNEVPEVLEKYIEIVKGSSKEAVQDDNIK